jgi:abortive infection bacteriophage resistance protein
MPLKPSLSYAEQLSLLQSRGCSVVNTDNAVRLLTDVNYYRLSGYFYAFRNPGSDDFIIGTTFERIVGIYEFDQKLRDILSHAIGVIEVRVRSLTAYHHAHKYGGLGYMGNQNFTDADAHEDFKRRFTNVIRQNKSSAFVRHHIVKYNGSFPIWVAVELFTVGMLSMFYSRMLLDDRKAIAKELGTDYVHFQSWLHSLTILRNRCAHYERLYGFNFKITPKLPKTTTSIAGNNRHSLFAQVFMLKLLYHNLQDKWNNDVLAPLIALLNEYREYVDFDHIGFPENWEEILRRS